jgi:dTDP-4-dehydrorhamnose 3,5-epimerase-like enzyme
MQKTNSSINYSELSNPFVILPSSFEDARGNIQTLVEGGVHSVQVITSKAHTVRANHWHREDSHYLYMVEGVMEYYYRAVGESGEPNCVIVNKGQLIFTPPMLEHATYFLEDSVFLNITGKPRDQGSYENDTVRVELFNPDKLGSRWHA